MRRSKKRKRSGSLDGSISEAATKDDFKVVLSGIL
jgi:hypothetical protein